MSISKNQLKLITSLARKKYRQKHGLFVAEGVKVVNELLASNLELHQLFCTDAFAANVDSTKKILVTQQELQKASFLKSANEVLAIFKISSEKPLNRQGLTLVLDDVNDPGNLGTIIRLCDWFGVNQLICSENTVDCYNPKVIQSTMASFARVDIVYTDIENYLKEEQRPLFATQMNGENVYTTKLPKEAVFILGNEANGIRNSILEQVKNHLSIPQFGAIQETESLNVATATAIFLSEFRR